MYQFFIQSSLRSFLKDHLFAKAVHYIEECYENSCLLCYICSKDGCFYRYFHILEPKKIDCLFQAKHIQSDVYNSGVAEGKQRGILTSNNHC